MPEKVLDYPLTEAKATTVDGPREQKAVVNQEPKENITNTVLVEEVKEIAKEALDISAAVCEIVPAELSENIGDIAALAIAKGV